LCWVIVIPSTVLAQETISVKGTVFDSDGLSIPGVTVVVQGTTRGTVTGNDGKFSITVPKGSTLEFSFIGYERQSVLIDDASDLRIVLVSDVVALSEVVVVGYGVQAKESVVGAIGQITSENLASIPVTNITHAITGQAAGITTFQSTGELGRDDATIRIRGIGSYTGSQQPLFVIDGLIRDAAAFTALDVYDISGINILKDASATAVYGVRGANGVIIVTTQRGRGEILPPQVTATANFGVGRPTTLPRTG
jgi:TonB-dependent SusC/RagA subfamily outer membrane receptor